MSLRERREMVQLYGAVGAARQGGVLFSVVRVAGSSYRQPGARLLRMPGGETAGTLSGGCLEADLLRRASWIVRSGAVVERFSTAFDDTAEIPYGLGCGGEIDLLAEPLDTPEAVALLLAMEATLRGEQRTVATRLPGENGSLQRIVLDGAGDVVFAGEALATDDIVGMRQIALGREAPGGWSESQAGVLYTEELQPVQRILIFGAGEDARPLARLAGEMGWLPVVIDTRAHRITDNRFPGAERVHATSAAAVPVLPGDAVILMTHSYAQDRNLLTELLRERVSYLGMLGARHRSALLLQEASVLADVSLESAVAATHAPVGLELGGEGPEAVALAIVSEVQQVLSGRGSGPLVHPRRMGLADVVQSLQDGPAAAVFDACVLAAATEPEAVTW